ncbi:hypothetical protein AALP_AAs73797U000200 [Arabis alpina]|uniref:Uncharacterized protein n=1 Tax=Arabis alpina TaxID=50452 RepID=A0A087FZ19_ARAAL|nr:hypothetical protein AALP_AAs73797U000200 [Arabis alpina]
MLASRSSTVVDLLVDLSPSFRFRRRDLFCMAVERCPLVVL